jgi:cell volume regulation protein A
MIPIEYVLLIGSSLILVSIALAKLCDNIGVPSLLLFLGIGMLAGSEGPGGIYFDDAGLAQSVGIIALAFILFAGGLDTSWSQVKPVFWRATSLATLGVLVTALAVGLFATLVLNFSLVTGLLLGAVVSSTDAATVFSVLRSRNVNLRGQLRPLLELESGSNDPMAVFLTVGLVQLLTNVGASPGSPCTSFCRSNGPRRRVRPGSRPRNGFRSQSVEACVRRDLSCFCTGIRGSYLRSYHRHRREWVSRSLRGRTGCRQQ